MVASCNILRFWHILNIAVNWSFWHYIENYCHNYCKRHVHIR